MFGNPKMRSPEFGIIHAEDDSDIEVQHLRRESRRGLWGEVGVFVRDILFALCVMILIGVFVVQPVAVEGTSILPELHNGERLLVNKLIYYKSDSLQKLGFPALERGDVVVFWFPNNPEQSFVKRIIGLPGETVEIRSGVIYIDGKELKEPYLDPDHNTSHANYPPKKVDPHYYFVSGDNRDNSYDSRNWGLVPEKYIYGKAMFRYYPLTGFGFIAHGKSEFNTSGASSGHSATTYIDSPPENISR
ncbi:MAG TPA: signal peptidase I [Pyrinomonadaceae bacterium]|nr:signal peptidase I [Pyrinomonadaceae bacterium]